MLSPARHLDVEDFADGALDFQNNRAPAELRSGERICAPRATGNGGAMLRAYVFIFAVLGGGWVLVDNQSAWQMWSSAMTTIAPLVTAQMSTSSAPAPSPAPTENNVATKPIAQEPATPPLQPLASRDVAAAPSASEEAPAPQSDGAGSANSASESVSTQSASGHESPEQMRAAAVGLNPDLSQVLLAQLSPADYRNAGIAIRTALDKTPDNGVFVWPRQRQPELALFSVRFVPGAAAGCRRYVVTITKRRWSTTALPMEKCGSAAMQSSASR